MNHLRDDFISRYADRRNQKYTVYGNYTSLPADRSKLGRDADMIYVKFRKTEVDSVFITRPEDGEIYIRFSNSEWTPGIYRNQKFVPSATPFNIWLQDVILENYRHLEARLEG